MNPRLTKKDINLIKGAIRRVFSRSDIRRQVIDSSAVDYTNPLRPRVKKWSICAECKEFTPKYLADVDHIIPVVPLNKTLDLMTWDEIVDRIWCDPKDLQVLCKPCHKAKSKIENKKRREFKVGLKRVA